MMFMVIGDPILYNTNEKKKKKNINMLPHSQGFF